jgi:hypothetical protein
MSDKKNKRKSLTEAIIPAPARSSAKSLLSTSLPGRLRVQMESPPLVFYGSPATSSGALLSGQLRLEVDGELVQIETFEMTLGVEVTMKKPFQPHCDDCTKQVTKLSSWNFLHAPATFNHGEHDFPFSFLLPGHLPASTSGMLSTVQYILRANAYTKSGERLMLVKELNVRRAVIPSEMTRSSTRIFPPTNLTAHVVLPSVVHPIGEFNCEIRLNGIVKVDSDAKTQTHWKLKRLNWRLDEIHQVISPACAKHAAKAGAAANEKKGIAHNEGRLLNSGEVKSGWKADYSAGPDACIEMEFPFSMRADVNSCFDVKAEDGTQISHTLTLELVVAEEVAPLKKPGHAQPTGAARVLRMNYTTTVTERSGLGISWDEEQPPLYEDVPASPPTYGTAEAYTGAPIPEYEEIERLR